MKTNAERPMNLKEFKSRLACFFHVKNQRRASISNICLFFKDEIVLKYWDISLVLSVDSCSKCGKSYALFCFM